MSVLAAIIVKDLRLLLRDRAALVFIAIAPLVVISVAGFSLASLYGATPTGQTGYELAVVDEDDGPVAGEIDAQLARDPSVRVRRVQSRAVAERLVTAKKIGSALVVPAGTAAALADGRPARVLLYVDPVKYLERLNVRLRVLEASDALRTAERERAANELEQQRATLRAELERLTAGLAELRARIADAQRAAESERQRAALAVQTEAARLRDDVSRQIDAQLAMLRERTNRMIAARLDELRAPARDYLDALAQTRTAFAAWFAELQRLAARRADAIPPPPAFPEPPPELLRALDEPPPALELPERVELRVEPRPASLPELPEVPDVPLAVPDLSGPERLPAGAALTIDEVAVGGGPVTVNTFDQNVPGFSVTFVLLGMLLGVSLGLLDERGWGTLDRIRALPVWSGSILLGKLAARFLVGVAQMLLLFAIGKLLFGVSLGPQPWALLLPIVGIVFAGTAFGLVIAGFVHSRDAVLPIGSIAIVTMAAVGGCWWPIDLEPQWMRTVALAFPTTWAMEAFNDLMIRARTVEAAYRPTAVLAAYGCAYLAVGLAVFRRRAA